jgi:predicted TIM-barrel fold metal-dependent hydrolase
MDPVASSLDTPKIDVHCHVFRSDDWAASSDHLVECSNQLGISEVWCCSPIVGGRMADSSEVRAENDIVLRAISRHPTRIRGLCFVIPGYDAIPEIDRCLDAGMIGIKLYNQYRINDPVVRPIIELALDRRVPILEHAGAPNAEHKGGQPLISHGVHFAEVNDRYPDAIIYHAHMGGGGDWEYTIRAIRDCSPNLYIDVSGSNLDYDQVGFAVSELGAGRILFGTDGTMAGSIGKVIEADISEDERQMIWRGNATRILEEQNLAPLVPKETARAGPHVVPSAVSNTPDPLIDLNAWVGSFPFRSVAATPDSLLARMDRFGIEIAAVSSIESAYHRNVQPANDQLFEALADYRDRLVPIPTVSPTYPKWEQDLATAVDSGARGIRLIPQTHDYRLTNPPGHAVIEAISATGLPVFLPHRIEDPRQHHWMDPGSAIDLGDIADIVEAFPETTFVINNGRTIYRSPLWRREALRSLPWYVDLSLAEIHYSLHWGLANARDLANMIDEGGDTHLVFGTHQPFSYVASARVKLATLGLSEDALARIAGGVAAEILGLDR